MNKQGYGVYQEAQAQELDQAKLILMMYTGAITFLNKALEVSKTNKIEMGKYMSQSKNFILELMASLNVEKGGEMGNILLRTYRMLFSKLNAAHMRDDIEKIAEVRDSLEELKETWIQVFSSREYQEFKKKQVAS